MPAMLAMHMADQLLSLPVAQLTLALAAGAVALSIRRLRHMDAQRLPLMGVMGAFVFAAQMINFTLPGIPGTSGHLGGAVLLTVLLGPAAAIVSLTAVLLVQCLLFQDGGLLALGCNIINMAVAPALLGWAIYRLLAGGARAAWRLYLAAWAACLAGLSGGAALVAIEASASGVLQVPLRHFLAVMLGVHVVIALLEGTITFSVLAYLRAVRPELIPLSGGQSAPCKLSLKALCGSMLVTALLLAGVVSWFASPHPDGLEKSVDGIVRPADPQMAGISGLHSRWSIMRDYGKRPVPLGQLPPEEGAADEASAWPGPDGWGSLAGLAGTAATLGLLHLLARRMRRRSAQRPQVPRGR